jgi:predicted enzyme related to lactoylglutathione lyase
VKLAKPHVDFGLYTTDREAMLAFWQQRVGLPFEELLPAGRGIHQLRHGLNGSVMKINHSRAPLDPHPASGYRELRIARAGLTAPERLIDPDGNRIALVPKGSGPGGVERIGIHLAVRDPEAFGRFYREALGLAECGDDVFRCGDSILSLEADANAGADTPLRAPGFRYITIQVTDVDTVHRAVVAKGGREGTAPVTLGRVARISFVRDPDGNWIELSQRASLTGPLPG